MGVVRAIADEADAGRWAHLRGLFEEIFGAPREGTSFVEASAPGRVEVAGNHVDHQGGRVISAAIGERTWGLAAENGLGRIRAVMEGFGTDEVDLSDPSWAVPHPVEALSSAAMVRGMAALFEARGGAVRGFDIVTCSDVPPGCGLSS